MSYTLVVPPLNDSATEFVVEQYYVAVDEPIVAGQPIALVRSERWAWDVPATTGGVIGALLIEPGDTVVEGAALIELRDERPTTNDQPRTTNHDEQQQAIEAQNHDVVPTAAAQRMRATPVARRMIAAHGLDLAALTGTGRGNVVTRTDVLAVLGTREQAPSGYQGNREQAPSGYQGNGEQRTTIEQPQTSTDLQPSNLPTFQPSNIPYALTAIEVDLATALATVAQHQARWARRGVTISITACVVAAAAAVLGEHHLLNSAWHDDGIILRGRVQLAIEHRTTGEHQRTFMPHAADLNAVGIARWLAHGARHEEIERQPATFVIMEHAGPWWAHALPDGSCTAQLSVSAVVQQPHVVATAHGDQIMVRPTMVLTLAYDARVATQPDADALLCAIKKRLEHLHSL